jgi:hypothetical protein
MPEKAENTEKKTIDYSECPKCRKHGYYQSKEFYACRYCGYTAPDAAEKRESGIAFNKQNHGTKPGGMRF